MLKINNLKVDVNSKTILDDLNLIINKGEIHGVIGPNGAGKSTLAKVLLNTSEYKIVEGEIFINNKNFSKKDTSLIAREGVFLLSQNPLEIEGVTNFELLRSIVSENKEVDTFRLNKECEEVCKKLKLSKDFIHREINVSMSGGEKKKNELLHMWILKPRLIILDEVDSGLDINSFKTVANSLKEYYELYKPTILIITHNFRIFDYLIPNKIHVLDNKKITKSGNLNLIKKIEKEGF